MGEASSLGPMAVSDLISSINFFFSSSASQGSSVDKALMLLLDLYDLLMEIRRHSKLLSAA